MGGSESSLAGATLDGLDVPSDMGTALGIFEAKYLGSVPVKQPTGNDVCADAVTRVKEMQQPEKNVKLVVSPKGVYIFDVKTGEIIKDAPVKELSFVSMDPQDKKLFSYITNNKSLNLIFCHTFQVKNRAQDIPIAINQAFQISAGKMPDPGKQQNMTRKLSKKEALEQANRFRAPSTSTLPKEHANQIGKYPAKYLGSVSVTAPKGNEIVLDAIKRIKALDQLPLEVNIIVTHSSIDVVEARTGDIVKSVPVGEVSFTALDANEKKLFSYITNDSRLGLKYCHAFTIKGEPTAVPQAFGEAFKKSAEAMKNGTSAPIKELSRRETRLKDLGLLPEGANGEQIVKEKASPTLGVFEAKFIGSVPVHQLKGNDVVEKAVVDAQNLKLPGDGVVLVISSEGVRIIDGLTGEVVKTILVRNISFTTVAGPGNSLFAFISNDDRLQRISCHVFQSGSKSFEICTAIGEAFKVAAEEMKARAGDPFMPTSTERESVGGELFKKQIHRRDLKAGKSVGAGQFGQVYLATLNTKEGSRMVAVKMLRAGASVEDRSGFLQEAEVMLLLSHPNLVALVGVAVQQRPWLVVLEFMKYGDLRDVMQTCKEKKVVVSYLEQLNFAHQVCCGMEFIASLRYIHMDLALRNVLLHTNSQAKVADFGLTRPLDEGSDSYQLQVTAKLPIKWMAIESLDDKVFSQASDVWAFGILVWEIMSYGAVPYGKVKNQEVQRKVREGLRLEKPDICPDEFFSYVSTCWNSDRYTRPTFTQLKEEIAKRMERAKEGSPPIRDIGALLLS